MLRFRSLTAKFIFMGSIMLAFIATYITATYIFTHHMEGEAKRLNLAGRERMLMLSISYNIMSSLALLPSPERKIFVKNAQNRISEYEEALYGIRDGSERLGLKPIPEHNKESTAHVNALIELWENTQKPTLLNIKRLPPERKNEACGKCHSAIRDNLPSLDVFVKCLEKHYNKEIKDFDTFRYYAFGFFFIAVGFIIFYLRQSIIRPMWKLKDATETIEKGNFDVRVDIKSRDEIGTLGNTFTGMAKTISLLIDEQTKHLQELNTLNKLSSAVSKSLSVEEIANIALDEILGLEQLTIEKQGVIFIADEKSKMINLAAYRGLSKEFARLESVVPYGECLCGIAAETGEIVISDDWHKDNRHTRAYPEIKEHGNISIPLKSRDKICGVLCLFPPAHEKLTDEDISLYKSIADIIAIALQNALNHRQVAMLAQSLDSSIDLVIITDMEGKIIHANPQVMEHLGYTQDEITGMNVSVMQSPKNPSGLGKEIYEKSLEGGWEGEVINIRKNGTEYPVFLTTSPVKDESGNIVALIGISRDITEQKHAEESIKRNYQIQNILNSLLNVSLEDIPLKELLVKALDIILFVPFLPLMPKGGIFVVEDEPDVLILTANRGFSVPIQNICARVPFGRCLCGRAAASKQLQFADCLDDRHENRYDGITPHGHYNVPILSMGKVLGVLVLYLQEGHRQEKSEIEFLQAVVNTLAGIIERKLAEDALKEHTKELLLLADASNVVLTITTTENFYETICEIAVRNFGLKMAWLGLIEEGSFDVKPVAHSGFEEGYLSSVKVTWDDSPTGKGPCGMSIKTRRPYILTVDHPDFALWREDARKRDYASILGIPLIFTSGKCIGSLLCYSERSDYFIQDRVKILQVFGNQVATAIENRWLIEGLEEKIKERTKDLDEMNKELRLRKVEAEVSRFQAESASRAKSDFLANMSHELRTPLNSIIGFSELMRDGIAGTVTDDQKEYLNDIWESGKHLLRLINDILDLSKVEAGKMELELSEFNVKELINGCLILFKEKAMRHHIKLTSEVPDDISSIQADERKIKQTILNLLGNAFKFTPDGGGVSVQARLVHCSQFTVHGQEKSSQLTVDSSQIEKKSSTVNREPRTVNEYCEPSTVNREPADFIEVSVTDTGIGIASEDMEKLFQPFQQLESTLTKKYEGTGLGLKLCKDFVELHGGKIWAESVVGKGSKFTFVIPLRQTIDNRQ